MYVLHGFLSAVTYCTDEDPLPGEVRMIDSISPSNLLQEEWTSDTIVLFVCELDGTIDMPLPVAAHSVWVPDALSDWLQ